MHPPCHQRRCRACAPEAALEVRVECPGEGLFVDGGGRDQPSRCGVVDEDVKVAPPLLDLLEHLRDLSWLGDGSAEEVDRCAGRFELRLGLLRLVERVEEVEEDVCAARGQIARDHFPNTLPAPGDERELPFEILHQSP